MVEMIGLESDSEEDKLRKLVGVGGELSRLAMTQCAFCLQPTLAREGTSAVDDAWVATPSFG